MAVTDGTTLWEIILPIYRKNGNSRTNHLNIAKIVKAFMSDGNVRNIVSRNYPFLLSCLMGFEVSLIKTR